MSRSIKQYKDAMDSIRISESFAKRTETLLKEAGGSESVSLPRRNGTQIRRISFAACAGLAACIAAAFIFKQPPADIQYIESGDAGVTAVTSVTDITAAGDETVYVAIEEDDEEYIREDDKAVELLVSGADTAEGTEDNASAEETAAASAQQEAEAQRTENESEKPPAAAERPSEVTKVPVIEEPVYDEPTDEKAPSIAPIYPDSAEADDDEAIDEEDVGSGEGAGSEGEYGESPISDSAAYTASAGNASGLYYIDHDKVNAELVSYVNGTEAASSLLDSGDALYIISLAASAVYGAPEKETSKSAASDFVLTISAKDGGNTLYTVNIGADGLISVTAHTGGRQFRTVYLPDKKDFSEIEKAMFLLFGSESEYSAFMYGRTANR